MGCHGGTTTGPQGRKEPGLACNRFKGHGRSSESRQLPLKLTHCVTLGRLLYLSEPQFLHLEISPSHLFLLCLLSFERERERESTVRGGAEGDGGTESEAGSRLLAVSTEPDAGLEPTNGEIMT